MLVPPPNLSRQPHARAAGEGTAAAAADATGGDPASNGSAGSGGDAAADAATGRSRAEMSYYAYVESEGQLSTVFQAMTKDPVKIFIGLVFVFVGSLVTSMTVIGVFFDEVQARPISVLSIVMLLILQAQVLWRWFTLVRIRKYNYTPSTGMLKVLGGLRNLSPWIWVLSAMIISDNGALGTLFWTLFWIHLIVLDYFFTIVILFFVAASIIILPIWLPYTWMKPKGISKRTINKLPVVKFDSSSFVENEYPLECSICITEFEANEELRRLPCNHFFHKDCVDVWLHQNGTCPMCRNNISNRVEPANSDASSSDGVEASDLPDPSTAEAGARGAVPRGPDADPATPPPTPAVPQPRPNATSFNIHGASGEGKAPQEHTQVQSV